MVPAVAALVLGLSPLRNDSTVKMLVAVEVMVAAGVIKRPTMQPCQLTGNAKTKLCGELECEGHGHNHSLQASRLLLLGTRIHITWCPMTVLGFITTWCQ